MSKSPAFQFYPLDYLGDEKVQLLTSAQEGIYWRLINYCWREGSIPKDIKKLLSLCKRDATESDIACVIPLFNVCSTSKDRLVHKRLIQEMEKQQKRIAQQVDAGKKSAIARGYKLKNGSAYVEQALNSSSSSSTSVIIKKPLLRNVKKSEKDRLSKLSENFVVTNAHREFATTYFLPNPDVEVEAFRDYHIAKGTKMQDWNRAFKTWLRNAKKFTQQKGVGHAASTQTASAGYDNWMHGAELDACETGITIDSEAIPGIHNS